MNDRRHVKFLLLFRFYLKHISAHIYIYIFKLFVIGIGRGKCPGKIFQKKFKIININMLLSGRNPINFCSEMKHFQPAQVWITHTRKLLSVASPDPIALLSAKTALPALLSLSISLWGLASQEGKKSQAPSIAQEPESLPFPLSYLKKNPSTTSASQKAACSSDRQATFNLRWALGTVCSTRS